MSTATKIEWTRGDDGSAGATWNPITGCREVSEGCEHCYAETFTERWRGVPGHPYEQGFDLRLWPERLQLPFRWRKPRRVFVNSMSDLFHDGADPKGGHWERWRPGIHTPATLPRRVVLAIAELSEVLPATSLQITGWLTEQEAAFGNFAPGRWVWVLDNVQVLPEPIPARGAQYLWTWNHPGGRA